MLSRALSWKSPLVWKCDIRWVWINMRRPFLPCLHRVVDVSSPGRLSFLVRFLRSSSSTSLSSSTTRLFERAHTDRDFLKLFYLKFYNPARKETERVSVVLPTLRTLLMTFSVCTAVHRRGVRGNLTVLSPHQWSPMMWHWRVPLIYLNKHLPTIKIRCSDFILAIIKFTIN